MNRALPMPFLFLDLETTGYDPLMREGNRLTLWHEIIDIGAVAVDQAGLEIIGTYSRKVRPEHPERCVPDLINHYPVRAAKGDWRGAFSLSDALSDFLQFLSTWKRIMIPVGQNFFFNWSFLSAGFAWCGIHEDIWREYLHYTNLDTRSMAVQELLDSSDFYDPDLYSIRTGELLDHLGIDPEPIPHEAINGARKSFEVYKAFVELKRDRF